MVEGVNAGGSYSVAWNSARATSTNAFTNYDPLLSSNVALSITQPLLRNFKIDNLRQQRRRGLG